MATGPYSRSSLAYIRKGWMDPIPMGPNAQEHRDGQEKSKLPGVSGFTGYEGKPVGFTQAQEWNSQNLGSRNIGLRMLSHTVAIDVDHGYGKDGGEAKQGGTTIANAEAALGALPATWTSTARGPEQPSRISLFRLPVGKTVRKGAEKAFNRTYGEDVEIIHRTWRHVVVFPSLHPSTQTGYEWYRPDGTHDDSATQEPKGLPGPTVVELPELPEAWVQFLCDEPAATASEDDLFESASTVATLFGAPSADGSKTWRKAKAEAVIAEKLAAVRAVDSHSKVRDTIGGAARLLAHFVAGGEMTTEAAYTMVMEAVRANAWHSDEWNKANGKDWTAHTVVASTLEEHAGKEPWTLLADKVKKVAPPLAQDELFTEAALAQVVADELMVDRFLWTAALGWLAWSGKRWEVVEERQVREAVRVFVLQEYARAVERLAEAVRLQDKEATYEAQAALDGWFAMQGKAKLDNLVALCSGMVVVNANSLDQNHELLNCPNGIVNLRTGALLEHDPALLMTKITAVDYVPDAADVAFKTALQAVPAAVEPWLQVRFGQALTGLIPDKYPFVILTGGGENGKTTILNAIMDSITPEMEMDAGYGRQIVSELLLKTKDDGSAASPAKMALMGTRFAYFEETPEGRHLDVDVVKKLTDTPKMTARKLYKDHTTFTATHSMFLNTNYVPTITETDHGTWRRLIRVDFPYEFVGADRTELEPHQRHGDAMLKVKLRTREAREAILSWLVSGARQFLEAGTLAAFPPPAEVAESTAVWRLKSDSVLDFMSGTFVWGAKARGAFVDRKTVYVMYADYCKENGQSAPSMATFLSRLCGHSTVKGVSEGRKRADGAGHSPRPSVPGDPFVGSVVQDREHFVSTPDAEGLIRVLTGLKFA